MNNEERNKKFGFTTPCPNDEEDTYSGVPLEGRTYNVFNLKGEFIMRVVFIERVGEHLQYYRVAVDNQSYCIYRINSRKFTLLEVSKK